MSATPDEIEAVLARARENAGIDEIPTVDRSTHRPHGTAPSHHEPTFCSSCRAPILWAQILDQDGQRIVVEDLRNGRRRMKSMPVDFYPAPSGNVVVADRPGQGIVCRVLRRGETPPPGSRLRTSHFQSCPHAKKHRRR